jgi:hypothetical protein
VWLAFGRRAGKDIKAAAIVAYLATIGAEMYGWRKKLTSGERGVVALLAVDRDQAQTAMEYVKAFFEKPMLARMVKKMTADSVELTNRIVIDVMTSDQRRIRGRTMIAAVLDEVGHWRAEATANADDSIYEALSPSLSTMGGGMIIGISSPHMRRGLLYRKITEHWAKNGDPVLVARAPTWKLHPALSRDSEVIEAAYKRNPSWADAEYGANWRNDLEGYVNLEVVRSVIDKGVYERRPERRHRYFAFCDPSGGVNDSMTLAIGHREGSTIIVDCIREVCAPFDPESVTAEFSDLLRSYRVKRLTSDRFSGEWTRSAFRKNGISVVHSEQSAAQLYLDFLPQLNSGEVSLLDNEKLVAQLTSLERSPRRGAHDSITHPKDMHDDIANAVAGVCCLIEGKHYAADRDYTEQRPTMVERGDGRLLDVRERWL